MRAGFRSRMPAIHRGRQGRCRCPMGCHETGTPIGGRNSTPEYDLLRGAVVERGGADCPPMRRAPRRGLPMSRSHVRGVSRCRSAVVPCAGSAQSCGGAWHRARPIGGDPVGRSRIGNGASAEPARRSVPSSNASADGDQVAVVDSGRATPSAG